MPSRSSASALAAIRDPVEDAGPVGQAILHDVAIEHRADVAVAGDGGREGALDEGQRAGRDQPLDAERLFLFADAHLGERTEAQIDVSVLENRCPAAEIGRQAEVEVLEDGALDDRAHPAKQKRIDALNGVFAQEEATVGLHEPAESQLEAVVGRSQLEPTLSRARDRCRLHRFRLLLPFELESSLENAELLVELVQCLRRRQSLERGASAGPAPEAGFASSERSSSASTSNLARSAATAAGSGPSPRLTLRRRLASVPGGMQFRAR